METILAALCLGAATVVAALWLRGESAAAPVQPPPPLPQLFAGFPSDRFVGARLANWRLLRPVGRGSTAVVYRAVPNDTLELSEACAIKILNPELTGDPVFRERFKREVRVLLSLEHRHIVRLDDYGEFEGLLYLVTELVNGLPLRKRIRPDLPLAQVSGWMDALLEAMAYAHGKGVVHRNLKPENVMVRADGFLKLVDFGLARPARGTSPLTLPGQRLGTPAYMAPEQVLEAEPPPDGRCDQYALGVILCELLTGKRPFDQAQAVELLYGRLAVEPPRLRERRPDLPEPLEEVFRRMIAREPADRYPTLSEAREELRRALSP